MATVGLKRYARGSTVFVAICGALVMMGALTPASGAWYFDARDGSLTSRTVSLNMAVSDAHGTDVQRLDIVFDALKPGDSQTQSFTVRNTGTIPGNVSIRVNGIHGDGLSANGLAAFFYTVDGYGTLDVIAGITRTIGQLQPGESRTYSITNMLSGSIGNDWQGKTVTSDLSLYLEQDH